MTDLISRDAVLALFTRQYALDQINALPAIQPQVVANISGGLLQGASSDYPVDIYALDFDTEGCAPSELIEVDGDEARLGQDSCDVDPDFVRKVLEAPYLEEEPDDA